MARYCHLAEMPSLDNSVNSILWVGRAASTQILQDLFGVKGIDDISPSVCRVPCIGASFGAHGTQSAIRPGSLLSTQLSNIIRVLESRRGGAKLPFHVALQDRDAVEIEFSNMLVEDQNDDAMS